MSQELHQLPAGWEWLALNKVVEKTANLNPSQKPDSTWDYIDISSIDRDKLLITEPKKVLGKEAPSRAKKQIQVGDVIFATTRPNLKNIAAIKKEYELAVASTGFSVLRASNKLDSRYLFYFVTTDFLQQQIEPFISGASYPAITDTNLKKAFIPLPALAEQRRLVKKLDTLFSRINTAIEYLEHSLELNDQLFASSLNQAFNPLDAKIQSDGTYQLPEGWEWKKLSKISSFFNGYAFKKNQYSENGMPLLRITNIQNGEVVKNNQIFIDLDKTEKKAHEFVVNPSDIVIAMSGATTGKVAINHTSTVFLQNQRVGRFVIPDLNLRDFVFYFLAHIAEENLNKAFGAAQPNLSTAQINSINVPLPNSSNLEKVITTIKALAKATKTNKQALQKKLEQLQQLKASLLDSAFRGEL